MHRPDGAILTRSEMAETIEAQRQIIASLAARCEKLESFIARVGELVNVETGWEAPDEPEPI